MCYAALCFFFCQVLVWLRNVKQRKHTHIHCVYCTVCSADANLQCLPILYLLMCVPLFYFLCALLFAFWTSTYQVRSNTQRGRKGARADGCSSTWPFWTPTHIMTLQRHFHSAIYKPLCLFRNSVGLLCISDSLSGRRREGRREGGRRKGWRRQKAQMDSSVKQLTEQSMTFAFAHQTT